MKTDKKGIRISLTNLEKDNLDNVAAKEELQVSKLVNQLILNEKYGEIDKNDLSNFKETETTTFFNLDLNLFTILEKESQKIKTTKNKLLRYLISKLEIVEDSKKETLTEFLTATLNYKDVLELKELAAKNYTSPATLIRQVFNKIELINIYTISSRKNDFDDKIIIAVSPSFKEAFSKEAKNAGATEADLLRSIVYSLIVKNPKEDL